jgi:hypothetical protein
MRSFLPVALILSVLGSASVSEAGYSAIATLHLNGQVGNPILSGLTVDVTYTSFVYGYNTSQAGNYINGSPSYLTFALLSPPANNFALLTFGSNELNEPLTVGTYSNAERASFASPGFAGLDVSYGSSGSNTLTGSFTISTLSYFNDPGNNNALEVASFAASFTQYTDGNPAALTGTLVYQNLASVPEPSSLGLLVIGLAGLAIRRWRGQPDHRIV